MTSQSEAERDKAVVDAFYQGGMDTLAIRVSSERPSTTWILASGRTNLVIGPHAKKDCVVGPGGPTRSNNFNDLPLQTFLSVCFDALAIAVNRQASSSSESVPEPPGRTTTKSAVNAFIWLRLKVSRPPSPLYVFLTQRKSTSTLKPPASLR
jgi:hypothetical protein